MIIYIKKGLRSQVDNYRPVSILLNVSKLFERLLFEQMSSFLAYRDSWTLDAIVGRWTLDAKLWMLEFGRWTLDAGLWALDSGRWTLDSGLWTLDAGLWKLDLERWTLDAGRWTVDAEC